MLRRYDISNWSVWTTYQWDVTETSQIGPSHSRTSRDVVMTSQHGPRRLDLYDTLMRHRYHVACRVGSNSNKQRCYYWLTFYRAKHIRKNIIKCDQYFTFFIWIIIINIFVNIINVISVLIPLKMPLESLKCFKSTLSCFLINNWYFVSYTPVIK